MQRPGTTELVGLGQASDGNVVIGSGTETSLSSYLKIGPGIAALDTGGGVKNIYHEGFKPTAADVGALPLTGGTMTDLIAWGDGTKYINGSGVNIYLAAKEGTAYIEGKNNPVARVGSNDYPFYHTGNKPTAADVGAL